MFIIFRIYMIRAISNVFSWKLGNANELRFIDIYHEILSSEKIIILPVISIKMYDVFVLHTALCCSFLSSILHLPQ